MRLGQYFAAGNAKNRAFAVRVWCIVLWFCYDRRMRYWGWFDTGITYFLGLGMLHVTVAKRGNGDVIDDIVERTFS